MAKRERCVSIWHAKTINHRISEVLKALCLENRLEFHAINQMENAYCVNPPDVAFASWIENSWKLAGLRSPRSTPFKTLSGRSK